MSITYNKQVLETKANQHCEANNTIVTNLLGYGTQGMVFKTAVDTAIKVHSLEGGYKRELSIYRRLKGRGIQSVRGLKIPRLKSWDDSLFIIEMSIVHVPCIIDFGGTYLDVPPEHLERDEDWLRAKEEEFGEHWEEAQAVVREIEFRGDIWLSDINTGNIKFY